MHVTHSFNGICEDKVVLVKPSSRILKKKSNIQGNIYSINFMLRMVFLTLLWKNRDSFAHKYDVNLEKQTRFSILQHRGRCYG